MNGVLWVTQTRLVVSRYSRHAATRREREHPIPRFTFDPPRSSQVRGRRPRISRDLSDRATIVSRGCRNWLGTCLDTPLAAAPGMNGALWVTQTCLVVPRYSHHAATRHERLSGGTKNQGARRRPDMTAWNRLGFF